MTNHPNRKLATITLSGGFHRSPAINVRVPLRVWAMVMQGMPKMDALSDDQKKRLDLHFCGITGCTCGGPRRADWALASHRVVPV